MGSCLRFASPERETQARRPPCTTLLRVAAGEKEQTKRLAALEKFFRLIAAPKYNALRRPMLLIRRPEELFAAEDGTDWDEWVDFFGRTREPDGRRKGLVEVIL